MTCMDDRNNRRPALGRLIATMALALATVAQSGCLATGTEFREAAGPAVEQGLNSIVDGLLDGLFATIEPDGANSGG